RARLRGPRFVSRGARVSARAGPCGRRSLLLPRDLLHHVRAQPTLPVERGRLLIVDVDLHVVRGDVEDLLPGHPEARRATDAEAAPQRLDGPLGAWTDAARE